nr:MAG TPA: helix-turn-helix domain-containing protein [Caudoviricetes sp.]
MKAVLLSIRPNWCKLICRGEAFGIERPPQSWYYVEVYG